MDMYILETSKYADSIAAQVFGKIALRFLLWVTRAIGGLLVIVFQVIPYDYNNTKHIGLRHYQFAKHPYFPKRRQQ